MLEGSSLTGAMVRGWSCQETRRSGNDLRVRE